MSEAPVNRPEPLAYLNGEWIPLSRAGVGVFDGGFLQGVTVAEQLRTFGGRVFRLETHLERLARSLEIVDVEPNISLAEIGQIATELTEQNRQLLDPADDQGVTILVTPGPSSAYAAFAHHQGPTICIHTQPLAFASWVKKYSRGDSLVVTDVMQVPPQCWPPELKCRSRMHYYLADKKARATEPRARALLLDERGFVTEASSANVLAYWPQFGLVSPPKEYILPGVTVAVIEELAAALGIAFVHRELTVNELAAASEVLLCSTSPCIWSVTRLNDRPIADGQPGPVAAHLRAAWNQMVGLDIEAQARRFAGR